MRIRAALVAVALVSSAARLVACSGSGLSGGQPGVPAGTAAQRTGVAPQLFPLSQFGNARPQLYKPLAIGFKYLAVADLGGNGVEILNSKYHPIASITNGLDGPEDDFYDSGGNLYVVNTAGINVTEYNPSRSLIFTYSADLNDPVSVSVDKYRNVYVADYGNLSPSVVVEYRQRSNKPAEICHTGIANEGVAIDSHNNVFVEGEAYSIGELLEYRGGLRGCHGRVLHPTVTQGQAGGLRVDRNDNLIACDQYLGADIIPPPYAAIKSTISSNCFHSALNSRQNVIFIAQPNKFNVLVDKYPSGAKIATLGKKNGLDGPLGVAVYPF
jgi:hypothetical protein